MISPSVLVDYGASYVTVAHGVQDRFQIRALLSFEAEPGISSFSTTSLKIWSMRIPAILVFSNSRQPFL